MPDEETIKALKTRRDEIITQIEFGTSDYATYSAIYTELLEIDEELARLGFCALGDYFDDDYAEKRDLYIMGMGG